ncbi:hypothetical protein EDD21DRAFT_64059, partial [Dissophora ornata]
MCVVVEPSLRCPCPCPCPCLCLSCTSLSPLLSPSIHPSIHPCSYPQLPPLLLLLFSFLLFSPTFREPTPPRINRLIHTLTMESIFKTLYDWLLRLFYKTEMELTLVGLQNSGKTTLVNVIAVSCCFSYLGPGGWKEKEYAKA